MSERLGELLVRANVVTEGQLQAALDIQQRSGGKIGEVLVSELIVTEDQIAQALAEQKGLEHVNLAAVDIDSDAALLIPLRMARRRLCIPISIAGNRVTLAMADPLDVEAIDETEIRTGLKVDPVVAAASQVRFAIEKYIAGGETLHELRASQRGPEIMDPSKMSGDMDVPIVRMVNQILREAALLGASDIHFEPADAGVRVRSRIDGVLREVSVIPKDAQAELLSRVKVMADLDITERRRPQDGRIAVDVDGRALDIRVATLPTPEGEAIVLRLLDSEVAFHSLDDVGLARDDYLKLVDMLRHPYGAILVAGPTGSGKSTTLYGILNEINDVSRKTITIEDPIEYRMHDVTQIAVNQRIGLTFAAGLRTVLRSDPDIVMVGEIRDPDTAETAVRAALTGHLVLSSIHTNDAPSALTRLNDMGVPPYITSSALIGVVAQRLVRVLCPHCKQEHVVPGARLLAAGFEPAEIKTLKVYAPRGCEECAGTGYRGRIGVFEVMNFDGTLSESYLRNAPAEEMRKLAIEQGMKTLRRDALDKVASGVTSLEEIDRVVI